MVRCWTGLLNICLKHLHTTEVEMEPFPFELITDWIGQYLNQNWSISIIWNIVIESQIFFFIHLRKIIKENFWIDERIGRKEEWIRITLCGSLMISQHQSLSFRWILMVVIFFTSFLHPWPCKYTWNCVETPLCIIINFQLHQQHHFHYIDEILKPCIKVSNWLRVDAMRRKMWTVFAYFQRFFPPSPSSLKTVQIFNDFAWMNIKMKTSFFTFDQEKRVRCKMLKCSQL